MGIFNIDKIMLPRAVAVVGASEREGSVGRSVLENILKGGFAGTVLPINPKRNKILGHRAYASLSATGVSIDLAVIIVPLKFARGIIEECGRCGVGGAIIISGGGRETGAEGAALEQNILAAAKAAGVRIVGPNCVGVISSAAQINASFIHEMPKPGSLAFVSQSGATCTAVLDFAISQDIGFSHFISMGAMLDVDFGDVIDYLGNDHHTSAILLYVESITNHRKFMSAARAVARVKPIILLKVGRSAAGAKAAMSHTGAMAGEDAIYDEAFKRAGLVRVNTVGDLFDCAALIAKQPLPMGPRLAIVTNAGGPGVMATDYMALNGGLEPPLISEKTLAQLDSILPPFWSRSNPIDILGDATPETLLKVTQTCIDSREFDAILVLTTPQAQFSSTRKAKLICESLVRTDFPVFTSWIGGHEVRQSRELFHQNGIPTYETPERAVQAFLYLYQYQKNQITLQELPSGLPREIQYSRQEAAALIAAVLDENRSLMSEAQSKELLGLYGIPVPALVRASSGQAAASCARQTGFPVVLKLDSPDITHKSDAGGALALDARVVLQRAEQQSPRHLCISPYPVQYESHESTADGLDVFIRPIKPEDGPAMIRLFHALSPETIFQRFGRLLKTMPADLLSRHTQIDYDREMALVVFAKGNDEIIAVGRITERPGQSEADLGMTVADAWQGHGLGNLLMKRLSEIAEKRGITRILGVISPDNVSMLNIARKHRAELVELEDGNFAAAMILKESKGDLV